MIKNTNNIPALFSNLSDMQNQSHPLYQLADKIDWRKFETTFQPLYCQDNGPPGKPIRLMCGLLILKHLRNLSDESLVEQWSENTYCQHFVACRSSHCMSRAPLQKRSISANVSVKKGLNLSFRKAFVWITRMMKAIIMIRPLLILHSRTRISLTPRMQSCIRKSWKKFLALWKIWGFPYVKAIPLCWRKSYHDRRFRNHPQNRKKALRADRRLHTIAGRRFIPSMSRKYNVSVRAKNIRNTNSATRYPSYVLPQALFLEPCPSAMNMTVILSSLPWNR